MARDMACITKVPGKHGRESYRVQVWDPKAVDPRTGKKGKLHRKTFRVLPEARTWRNDVRIAVTNGTVRTASRTTVREAAQTLLAGIGESRILDRSGDPYKPSTVRSYRQAVNGYLNDDPLSAMTISDVRRGDVQGYVERLRGKGLKPSTVANKLDPVRVLFRRALERDEIAVDPTAGLKLPAVRGRRERVATRQEAAALIDALPVTERALWGTAFYAGLRRGELRSLRWSDVDLAAEPAVIHVRRTWDDEEGEVATKTDAGFRTVPMTARLRELVVAHGLDTRRGGNDLVFGRTAGAPFVPSTVRSRARKAWEGLNVITPHEARHSAASYLIEAGLNDLELTVTIGHSDARTTKRIYGHLFSDSGASIAKKLDAYHNAMEANA